MHAWDICSNCVSIIDLLVILRTISINSTSWYITLAHVVEQANDAQSHCGADQALIVHWGFFIGFLLPLFAY